MISVQLHRASAQQPRLQQLRRAGHLLRRRPLLLQEVDEVRQHQRACVPVPCTAQTARPFDETQSRRSKGRAQAGEGGQRQERAGGYSPATRGEEGELRVPSHSGIRARRKLEHIADQHRREFIERERLLAHDDTEQMLQTRSIPAQMLQQVPALAVAGASPVPVQMRDRVSPVPVQTWQGASPVPAQTWQR